jgi:hypothetical protein
MVTLLFTLSEVVGEDRSDVPLFFQDLLRLQTSVVAMVGSLVTAVYFGAYLAFVCLLVPFVRLIPSDVHKAFHRTLAVMRAGSTSLILDQDFQGAAKSSADEDDVMIQVADDTSVRESLVGLDHDDDEPKGVIAAILKRPIAMRILIFVTARFIFLAVLTLLPPMGTQLYAGMSWSGIIGQTFRERATAWPYLKCLVGDNEYIIDIIGSLW